jgi:hypothetical protein
MLPDIVIGAFGHSSAPQAFVPVESAARRGRGAGSSPDRRSGNGALASHSAPMREHRHNAPSIEISI